MIRAIVTDIEGTTTSISFVTEVLFPYAKIHMELFIQSNADNQEVRGLLADVSRVYGETLSDDQAIAQLLSWIDEDRKIAPLKSLQGLIWQQGYHKGDFKGHVYPDAERKLRDWKNAGLSLFVYSSGSVHAQKLLFGNTEYGDLNPLFSGYFDTETGAKQQAESYRNIAKQIACPASEILFLSDIALELDAAKTAGFSTCHIIRGNANPTETHPHANNFDEVIISV